MEGTRIERMGPGDWEAVCAIFREGIATGNATFELEAPSSEAWDAKHLTEHRWVLREGPPGSGRMLGWAALSPYSGRRVYAGVAEVSLYVAAAARGRGVGRALLEALIEGSERGGIWTLQAGVFPENRASVALHRNCGFREVGLRERIGRLHGVWRDVLLLERRSAVAGTDQEAEERCIPTRQ